MVAIPACSTIRRCRLFQVAGDDSIIYVIGTLGPSLLLLVLVLMTATLARRIGLLKRTGKPAPAPRRRAGRIGHLGDILDVALVDAARINSLGAHIRADSMARLQDVVRLAPTDYRTAIIGVLDGFRDHEVIAIDLAEMDRAQAARLVDFCSGVTAVCSGWIFRVTDSVILLNPPPR